MITDTVRFTCDFCGRAIEETEPIEYRISSLYGRMVKELKGWELVRDDSYKLLIVFCDDCLSKRTMP